MIPVSWAALALLLREEYFPPQEPMNVPLAVLSIEKTDLIGFAEYDTIGAGF